MRLEQLKDEQKMRVRAELEVCELKQIIQKSQPNTSQLNDNGLKLSEENKISIIALLNKKVAKLTQELDKEKLSYQRLDESFRELIEGINSKNNETALFMKKLEEIIQKKNKLLKDCNNLREANKTLMQENSLLETEKEELKRQFEDMQKEAKTNIEKLRTALRKNAALTKQITVFPLFV